MKKPTKPKVPKGSTATKDVWQPYWLNTQEFMLEDPDALGYIYVHIAAGGTLSGFCDQNGYNYGTIYDWLQRNPVRFAKYKEALAVRKLRLEDRVLENLAEGVELDPREAFDSSGNLINPKEYKDALGHAITSVKEGKEGIEVKFTSRFQATESLGKHLGMFVNKTEVTGKDGGAIETKGKVEVTNEAARRVAFLLSQAAKRNEKYEKDV